MLPFPLLKRQKDKMGYELTLENCKTEQHQWAENRWLIKNIDLLVSFPAKHAQQLPHFKFVAKNSKGNKKIVSIQIQA